MIDLPDHRYPRPRRLRALCVEDESSIGGLVEHVLRTNLRIHVDTAQNGLVALEMIESRPPYDLIIVDYKMPKMDGGELYRQIERRRPDLLSRVLFITGDTLSESTLGFIASTGRRFLEKPFGVPDVVGAIRSVMQEAEPRHPVE